MSSLSLPTRPGEKFLIQDFPALASLGLNEEDLQLLTRQGFLSREIRRGNACFKLRFRRGSRQHVKYVRGLDVAAVRSELNRLHADARQDQLLAALTREALQRLRQTKQDLLPVLENHGFAFHGLAIRRRRQHNPFELSLTTEPTR